MKTIVNIRTFFMLLLAVILLPNLSFSQQKEYKKELNAIFSAFQKQDYEILKPLLDERVKVSEKIPIGMNDIVMPQVMAQLPIPDSYTVLKTEKVGENTKISTEYSYKDRDRKRPQNFTFNKAGKIIDLDILSDAKKVEASYGGIR